MMIIRAWECLTRRTSWLQETWKSLCQCWSTLCSRDTLPTQKTTGESSERLLPLPSAHRRSSKICPFSGSWSYKRSHYFFALERYLVISNMRHTYAYTRWKGDCIQAQVAKEDEMRGKIAGVMPFWMDGLSALFLFCLRRVLDFVFVFVTARSSRERVRGKVREYIWFSFECAIVWPLRALARKRRKEERRKVEEEQTTDDGKGNRGKWEENREENRERKIERNREE